VSRGTTFRNEFPLSLRLTRRATGYQIRMNSGSRFIHFVARGDDFNPPKRALFNRSRSLSLDSARTRTSRIWIPLVAAAAVGKLSA
jgi:hypothetical protein